MYSSRSLQICPLINLIGKLVLVETSRAGAPFPHCGAAHGASGGPRAGPEPRAAWARGVINTLKNEHLYALLRDG